MRRRALIVLCICLFPILTGFDMPIDHPDPKVYGLSRFAGGLGSVAAIPALIVCMPITVPLGVALEKNEAIANSGQIVAAPMIGLSYVVGNALGVVPWMIFGWWGNDDYEPITPWWHSPDPQENEETTFLPVMGMEGK